MNARNVLPAILVLVTAACGGDDAGGPGGGGDPAGRRFFLPTAGEAHNTGNPTVETDAAGNLHMIYPGYAGGNAYYGYCGPGCDSNDDVRSVKLVTDGTVANAMLALGPDGKPHVLLSTYLRVYYARCTGDCTTEGGWSVSAVNEHDSNLEVTGEALAVSPSGKPAYVAHTYRAYLGIGQKTPATWYVACEGDCSQPSGWTTTRIATQTWHESTLRFDRDGHPRLATVAIIEHPDKPSEEAAAYAECLGDCDVEASWKAIGLLPAFSDRHIARIDPAISMELTPAGGPRMAVLARSTSGVKNLAYATCDRDCVTGESWTFKGLIESNDLSAGLDLALAGGERPRIAYNAKDNILLAHCDEDCGTADDDWDLAKVEMSNDIPEDQIILYTNCTISAWFLRYPSLALGKDGQPRVAYVAEDISGGFSRPDPDPTKPPCRAGVDMVLPRFAVMSGVR